MTECPRCGTTAVVLAGPSCPDLFHEWTDRQRRQFAAAARDADNHAASRMWLAPIGARR